MKLRNKKTGEHGNYQVISAGNLIRVRGYISDESWQYDCLADFNDKWEDYKPAEPLIKDEKIRKAVRAWAELVPSSKLGYDCVDRRLYTKSDYLISFSISFPVSLDLIGTKDYTIAELCGEEEE